METRYSTLKEEIALLNHLLKNIPNNKCGSVAILKYSEEIEEKKAAIAKIQSNKTEAAALLTSMLINLDITRNKLITATLFEQDISCQLVKLREVDKLILQVRREADGEVWRAYETETSEEKFMENHSIVKYDIGDEDMRCWCWDDDEDEDEDEDEDDILHDERYLAIMYENQTLKRTIADNEQILKKRYRVIIMQSILIMLITIGIIAPQHRDITKILTMILLPGIVFSSVI